MGKILFFAILLAVELSAHAKSACPPAMLSQIESAKKDQTRLKKKFLHYVAQETASEAEASACIDAFVASGADVNSTGIQGLSALMISAATQRIQSFRALIKKGADVRATNKMKQTVLDLVCADRWLEEDERLQALKILVQAGVDINAPGPGPFRLPILAESAMSSLDGLVLDLIAAGADAHLAEQAMQASLKLPSAGLIPYLAANETVVDRLLRKGANPNGTTKFGEPALHAAISSGNLKSVVLLVERGADVQKDDLEGSTPLMKAMQQKTPEIVEYLIKKKADVHAYAQNDPVLGSVLNAAIQKNCDFKSIQHVVKAGVDLKKKNDSQETILHLAASAECSREVLELLVRSGAALEAKDKFGKTPLVSAIESAKVDNAKTLLGLGAQVEDVRPQIETILDELDGIGSDFQMKAKQMRLLLELSRIGTVWRKWLRDGSLDVAVTTDQLVRYLAFVWAEEGKLLPLPKGAAAELREAHAQMRAAQDAPWELSAKSLELENLPARYYRKVLEAARKPEARASRKFNPTAAQARGVLRAIVSDGMSSNQDYELMAWLVAKAAMPLDLDLLNAFDFKADEIKKDTDAMIANDPLKYKGSPNIAILKLVKSLLVHADEDYQCSAQTLPDLGRTGAKDKSVADTMNWLGIYGDNAGCDKALLSRLVRLVLEQKKVCEQDRDFILRAMRGWARAVSSVQYELARIILSSVKPDDQGNLSFEELLLISQSVGLRSELTQLGWIEQMSAFSEADPTSFPNELYYGLLKHSLGVPEAMQHHGKTKFKLLASNGRPGSLVKLCRLMKSSTKIETAALAWIRVLKTDLPKPRRWPKNLDFVNAMGFQSLQEEFERAGMAEDVQAIQSECSSVRPKASPAATPRPEAGEIFDPRRRVRK